MGSTRYVLLYRGTNEAFKTLIHNNAEDEYVKVEELYTTDHKISSGTPEEKIEAENDKMNFIIEGNDSTNPKGVMLFYFDGTKRISHRKWIKETTGYVIRDWKSVEDKVAPAGDYSGNYVVINGRNAATGIVISKKNPIVADTTVVSGWSDVITNAGTVITGNGVSAVDETWLINFIKSKTIGNLESNEIKIYGKTKSALVGWSDGKSYIPFNPGTEILVGRNALGAAIKVTNWAYKSGSYYSTYSGYVIDSAISGDIYTSFVIKPAQVQTMAIPAHYEEVIEAPYMIKDTYQKVDGEPWFVLKTSGSLASVIETAKKVADAIGLENLKLIKEVPIDQKIRIS